MALVFYVGQQQPGDRALALSTNTISIGAANKSYQPSMIMD